MAHLLTATLIANEADRSSFQRYYAEAGPDYAAWSRAFNMHFGFFRWGMNPFNREAMLEQMNDEILQRLRLTSEGLAEVPRRILDMGCGLGATLRSVARRLPWAELHGITLVPWQIEHGRQINESCPAAGNMELVLGDYERTAFAAESFDGVFALESSCYAHGGDKSALLRECHRLLRPGGRVVVADGFLGPGKLWGPQKLTYRKLCECWAIDTLGDVDKVRRAMEFIGFRDIVVEQVQGRVAPSVLHVPWVTVKFLLTSVLFGKRKMTRARWNNVLAPILLPLVGFPLGPIAYYIVSATRV
jgi:SAM-dependent methyltransferase